MEQIRNKSLKYVYGVIIFGIFILITSTIVSAQSSSCNSVRECADKLVAMSNDFSDSVSQLMTRMTGIEGKYSDLSNRVAAIEGLKSVTVYQCPKGTEGWNPGGAWGYYGCQGQITTSASCINIEYPHQQPRNCTALGQMLIK